MLFLSSYLQGLQDYVKGMKEDQKRVMLQMESWNRKEENEKEEFQHVNTIMIWIVFLGKQKLSIILNILSPKEQKCKM